jgi:RNA polymerase sigma-70 factor (ECF subfamily)
VQLSDTDPRERRRDVAVDVVTRLSVVDALAELPAHQRVAVVLVDVQGWSVDEAAEVLDVPVGTVKSRCARGRHRLSALLGHLRGEER